MRRPRAVPLGVLALVALGTAFLVLARSASLMGWAYADWVATSATTREALPYALPWVAGWGAWTSGRYLGPRSMLCPPSAVRSGAPVVRAQLTLLGGAALVGWLVGLAPLLVWTAMGARAGSPDVLVILGAAAVLLAGLGFGYLLGCLLPRVASVIVAATLTFLAILLVDSWGPAIAPLRLETPSVGTHETATVATFRIAFFGMLAILLLAAAARMIGDRRTVRTFAAFVGLLLLVPAILVGVAGRATAPAAVARDVDPPARCTTVRGLPVCVHAAKADLLQPFSTAVDRVLTVADAPTPALGEGVVDDALGWTSRPRAIVIYLQTEDADWADWAAGDVAQVLTGAPACAGEGDVYGDAAGISLDRYATSDAFALWIANKAGYHPPGLGALPGTTEAVERLNRLSPEAVRALYRDKRQQLLACQLPSSAIP